MTSWWDRASDEERLAQIDAGIDLRLTARQVGRNVGATKEQVIYFAKQHGRRFVTPTPEARSATAQRYWHVQVSRARRAYFSGEPLDLWRVA